MDNDHKHVKVQHKKNQQAAPHFFHFQLSGETHSEMSVPEKEKEQARDNPLEPFNKITRTEY